ncbi:hypothetical protein scyTo_0022466, partial [Scyliorhinus torazame]|nr:hypothetical protein [Scyliorhinus torazame]
PLAQLLQRRYKNQKEKQNNNGTADLNEQKVKAIGEMMDRIKNGVVLKSTQRKMELLDPNASSSGNEGSAVNELKGLLDTMSKRKERQYSWKREKKQSELETILLRRRKVTDTAAGPGKKGTEKPGTDHRDQA